MSISPNTIARCCAARFPQPVSLEDERKARKLVYKVFYINCMSYAGPRLPQIVYRSSDEEQDILRHVFRFDFRHYDDIFQNGFQAPPRGFTDDEDYYNLQDSVKHAGPPRDPNLPTPRAFIKTTLSSSLAAPLSDPCAKVVYRYEIYAPGGIFVGPTLGDRCYQREVAFVKGVAPQYIRAVQLFTISGSTSQGFKRLERSDPLNPHIILNAHFNPQSHPQRDIVIKDPAFYFKNRDNEKQALNVVIWNGGRVPRSISDYYNWYTHDVFDSRSYITAAFRSSRTNEAYLFMRNEYVLMNYAPGGTDDRILSGDTPVPIYEGYPSLADTAFGEQGIDCAFGTHYGNEAYIFSSNLCALINYAPGTKDDYIIKGPMAIASMFPFLRDTVFAYGVDAAFESSVHNEVYLFKGDQYTRINYRDSTWCELSILPIANNWGELTDTIFEHGIDAAFASHRRNEVYLFKGKHYALLKFTPGSTKDKLLGGVKEIVPDNWPSLRAILPRENRGLDGHDHA